MTSIFISYRRADAQGHAQHLHHRLAGWFDDASELFFDAQHIDSGDDFPQRLAAGVDAAAVVLVLIGPGWLDEINRRASLPEVDFVRREVEQALRRFDAGQPVSVIPVLLGGAGMPSASAFAAPLQGGLAALCKRDAHAFQPGKQDDWEHQFARLRGLIAAAANAPRERYRERAGQPRPWRVIEHALSANFQDPNHLLAALRTQLHGGVGATVLVGAGGAKAAALHGMGGIGKTQLALAYCHAYRDAYASIWWLRAETARGVSPAAGLATHSATEPARTNDTLLQQDALAACAAAGVAVPDGVAPSQVLKQWLAGQTAPWLLVFDNADDPQALRAHLPGPGPHHVIITSRRPDWGGLAKTVELATWTAQQGAGFLMQRLGAGTGQADAEDLSHALGGLPLALEQAASYIEATGGTVAQYLGLWHGAAAELLNKHSASTGYEHTVAATLSLAFKHLSPAAKQLLRLCAFAAPEPLPERFFTEGFEVLPAELGAAALKPLTWNDVAGELKRYALAQRDAIPGLDRAWLAGGEAPAGTTTELALTLHRLTQQVVRGQLAEPLLDGAALLNLLARACPGNTQEPRHWPRLAALLPHAVWLNDTGRGAWAHGAAEVQSRTWLLDRGASFLQNVLALYPQARAGFEQALAVRRSVLGDEHPDTLTSMNNLASALRAQGDLAGARTLHEQELTICRRVLGEEHPDTLTSINNLANTLRAQGDLAGARTLHQQELAVCRRVLGEQHPYTLISMSNLAHTLWAEGDLAGACTLEEEVLAVRRRVLGDDDPTTLVSMNNLAGTYWAQGNLLRACQLQEQVLAAYRRLKGEEHPDTLTLMNNLASTLRAQGDLAGARSLHEQVLAALTRVLGEAHPATLTSMNNLAVSLWHLGQREDAIALMTRASQSLATVLGAQHPDTKESAAWLAWMRAGG